MAQRQALGILSSNIKRNYELKPGERGFIEGARFGGVNAPEVAKVLDRPVSTIYSTCNRASSRHNFESQPRSGRPKHYTKREKRLIIRYIKQDPFATYAQLRNHLSTELSRRTLYTIIQDLGYGKWKAQQRPRLTEKVAKQRLEWALRCKGYTEADWAKIIWSDECSVELGSGHRQQWVFRLNFHGEKWKKDFVQPVKKGKGIRVMIWAAIWGENRSDLIRLERDFASKKHGYSAHSYLNVLKEILPTIYEPGLTFMQDNARIHTAKKVKDWLRDNSIKCMEWPPYSPDLNPIEHMWFPLKEGVYNVRPDIENCQGSDEKKEDFLWEALEQSWSLIRQDILKNIVGSMGQRVEAVIQAKGWYTKY